jgi:hypothetical protein
VGQNCGIGGIVVEAALWILGSCAASSCGGRGRNIVGPMLTSLTASRTKRQEIELSLLHEGRNQKREDDRARFVELRICYIGVNMAARAYQNAMRTASHAFESSSGHRWRWAVAATTR